MNTQSKRDFLNDATNVASVARSRKRLAICLVALSLVVAAASASHAAVIVADDFSGSTNGMNIAGLTPDLADLPGSTYSVWSQGGGVPRIDTGTGNPGASVDTSFNDLACLNIASSGSYVLPNTLTLSADLQIGSIVWNGTDSFRGIGLGFFSQPAGGGDASSYFTGLTVNPDGTLRLVTPGGGDNYGIGSTTFIAAPFAGFSTAAFYNLTYTVNTSTDTITSVFFNGINDTSDFNGVAPAGFASSSSSTTMLAGFYASADSRNSNGQLDNLSIASSVPEPASLSLLAITSIGLLRRRRVTAR